MQFHSFSTVRYTGSFYQDYLDQGNSRPISRRKVKRLQLLLLLNLPLLLDSSSTPPLPLLLLELHQHAVAVLRVEEHHRLPVSSWGEEEGE